MIRLHLTPLLLVLSLPLAAAGQTRYLAELHGGEEVPPVATDACGWARVTLNGDNSVTYDVRVWGLTATAAHIHDAPLGSNGPIIVTLVGGPNVWQGTSAPLTATQVADLRTRGLYINVHTAANPGGEVRGQIVMETNDFSAHITGSQEVPPSGSAATGTGTLTFLADFSADYDVTVSGVSGTQSHIHDGPVGVNGGIEFILAGGPTTWSGNTGMWDETQLDLLHAQGYYVNVHSTAFPAGEIRGQIIPDSVAYGTAPGCTALSLAMNGPPTNGATVTTTITGGAPNSSGFLLASLGPDGFLFKQEPFLIDASTIFIDTLILPLDGSGSLTLPTVIPPLPADGKAYFQFFNLDAAAPNGKFNVSNAVELPLVMLP